MALSPNEFAQLLESNEYEDIVAQLTKASTGMSKEEIFESLSRFDEVCEGWAAPTSINSNLGGKLHLQPIKERLANALHAYANYSALEKKAEENGMVMKECRHYYKNEMLMALETISVE